MLPDALDLNFQAAEDISILRELAFSNCVKMSMILLF